MKQIFSKSWLKSKQPRKQRKYRYNAPLHLKRKMLSSTLDKELRKKYGRRNISIRKDDEVKIMRGKFKGKQGKVDGINLRKMKVSIDGIQNTKKDGTKVSLIFDASNLKIMVLETGDKRRLKNRETTAKASLEKEKGKTEKQDKDKETKEKKQKNAPKKN